MGVPSHLVTARKQGAGSGRAASSVTACGNTPPNLPLPGHWARSPVGGPGFHVLVFSDTEPPATLLSENVMNLLPPRREL